MYLFRLHIVTFELALLFFMMKLVPCCFVLSGKFKTDTSKLLSWLLN
jgi:hypothetical protein